MTSARFTLLVAAILYAVFVIWYGGSTTPLSVDEADALIAEIEAAGRMRSGDAFETELMDSFRALTREDDGREFYMLNLMRLREQAVYPEGSPYDDDVRAAAARYSRAVVPALLARGSLPIFFGEYAGAFIPAEPADEWDQIGIVRYRSRRDMLDMALALAREGGGEHKWASLEKTIVFPVRPVFDFVFVRSAVFAVVFGLGGSLAWLLSRRDRTRSTA